MPHAQPPDASETNKEESRVPDLFPPVGNFNAVVPLSEIDADSEPSITPAALAPTPKTPVVRAATVKRAPEESEEATLVPLRAARTSQPFRPATRRPSWPVMIAALTLSLTAGLAAGVYLIKSSVPVELHAPASMTEGDAHDVADAAATDDSKPAQVASESRPEANPQADTNLEASTPTVDSEVSEEKTSRDLNAPKSVTEPDAPSGKGERVPETSPAKSAAAERTSERHAHKAAPSTTNAPAPPPPAVSTRRATTAAERTTVPRTPARSLPVSPPPSSAKSKRVIQWP